MAHEESHRSHRSGWLRAAVLGANDGIVSTSSLIVGVAAANSSHETIALAGIAGVIAGAMSMAAGEYVSVSSQADSEKADLAIEQRSLDENYDAEMDELAEIYQERGLEPNLAKEVAKQLMQHDALEAHARDDIGLSEMMQAKPFQAAFSSASAFFVGALIPLIAALLSELNTLIYWVSALSLMSLMTLGSLAAVVGGAPIMRAAFRVTFWGALAMLVTAIIGEMVDVLIL